MTDCEKCADAFASGAKFCPECGSAAKSCSKCGITLPLGVKFCPECGKSTIGAKQIASSHFGGECAEGTRDTAAPATGKSLEYAPPIDPNFSGFEAEVKDPAIKRLIVAIILGLVIIGVILFFAFRVSDTSTATPASSSPTEARDAASSNANTHPRSQVIYLNCVLSNSWGVGGWRVVLDTSSMRARASFIGAPNAWAGLTGDILDQNFALMTVPRANDYYDFGIQDQANYKLFMINKNTLAFRYIDAHTGLTDWGECRHAPVENPLP